MQYGGVETLDSEMKRNKRVKIKTLLSSAAHDVVKKNVTVKGWVKSVRKSKAVAFIVVNDGSTQENLQVVAADSLANYEQILQMIMGYSLSVEGVVVESQGKGQSIEIQATKIDIIGKVDENFPLQKKSTSLEFLRENAHLRHRTNTFSAVFRVRHHLAFATHQFFHERGFFYLNSPIVTASDCEGAGEMFQVTTLDLKNMPKLPNGEIDFNQDFFGRPAYLTVSGQLAGECFALGMGSVYTFGPTFRAENSNTARHLAEFWMVEPEVAFADLDEIAGLAVDYIKYLIGHALKHCSHELEFFQQFYQKDLISTLHHVHSSEFIRVTYTEAVDILREAARTHEFQFPVSWGQDLQTEHERYLTEVHFRQPVIVTDYPKAIKAFYMKASDDNKTVRAMDVLVPGIGEIIGGSQREDDYQKLLKRIDEMGLKEKDYWWYLDLRRQGGAPHSGFGLGFERAVMYITGMSNIRDVIAFPRTPKNADF